MSRSWLLWPGVPAAGHIVSPGGWWHPGPPEGCPKCPPPGPPDGWTSYDNALILLVTGPYWGPGIHQPAEVKKLFADAQRDGNARHRAGVTVSARRHPGGWWWQVAWDERTSR